MADGELSGHRHAVDSGAVILTGFVRFNGQFLSSRNNSCN
jgi:hypothetical protein